MQGCERHVCSQGSSGYKSGGGIGSANSGGRGGSGSDEPLPILVVGCRCLDTVY